MKILENFKEALNKGDSVIAIFMGLSKACDTLNHYLLIAKLEAYGFSAKYFSYTHRHLNKRLQKQMSILILVYGKKFSREFLRDLFFVHFNSVYIYINDIFFFVDDAFLSNYRDDTAH